MWNVTIRDKGINNEAITIQVAFENGEETIVRNFAGNTKEELDHKIKKQLDALIARDENLVKVSTGAWTAPTEPEVVKTDEEIARDLWLEKWREFVSAEKAMKALERNGITPTAEETQAFNDLRNWVAANRKTEYASLITD